MDALWRATQKGQRACVTAALGPIGSSVLECEFGSVSCLSKLCDYPQLYCASVHFTEHF